MVKEERETALNNAEKEKKVYDFFQKAIKKERNLKNNSREKIAKLMKNNKL